MRTSVVLAVLVVSGAVAAAASGAVGQPGERDDGSYAAPGTPLARQPGTSGKTLGGTRSQQPRGPGRVGANLLPPPATPRPGNPGNPGTGPIIILPQQPVIVLPGHDHHDDRDVVVVRPPGLTIDGSYRDDRFRLGFHLGSGFPSSIYRRHDGRHLLPYTHSYRGYDYQPLPTMYVLGTYSPVDPFSVGAAMSGGVPQVAPGSSPAQPAAPAELTTLQQAQLHLASGYAQNAVTLLREHLKASAEDYAALRLLGLALLDTGDTEEGVAVLSLAFHRQPSLAWTPVDPLALPGGAAGMRRRVESAVGHANRVKSASAWLTVATLMQSEGRDALAAKMLDRARAAGLSVPVYREMSQALRP